MHLALKATFLACAGTLACQQDPMNEIPMYGGVQKPPALVEADRRFVDQAVGHAGTPEKGADQVLMLGWEAMSKNDWRTAMKRFNQAWLLTPESFRVFWGFGAACSLKGDYPASIQHFTKAMELDPGDPALLTDFAYVYIGYALEPFTRASERTRRLDRAIELLQQAADTGRAGGPTYSNWAQALFYKGAYSDAWDKVMAAEHLDAESVDPQFLRVLGSRMPRPAASGVSASN